LLPGRYLAFWRERLRTQPLSAIAAVILAAPINARCRIRPSLAAALDGATSHTDVKVDAGVPAPVSPDATSAAVAAVSMNDSSAVVGGHTAGTIVASIDVADPPPRTPNAAATGEGTEFYLLGAEHPYDVALRQQLQRGRLVRLSTYPC